MDNVSKSRVHGRPFKQKNAFFLKIPRSEISVKEAGFSKWWCVGVVISLSNLYLTTRSLYHVCTTKP